MTPLELADEIEDGPGAFRTENVATMRLLAAALRLAEACDAPASDHFPEGIHFCKLCRNNTKFCDGTKCKGAAYRAARSQP